MPSHQLYAINNETVFEEFVCDLFNALEESSKHDFQRFGTRGQEQKGIDIVSYSTNTVIQCKLKDINKTAAATRKLLLRDIESDLNDTSSLDFKFKRFILVSTHKDDAKIQEYLLKYKEDKQLNYTIQYWGWDTLTKYALSHETILIKYFPLVAIPKPAKAARIVVALPVGALGTDLAKKNYISYLIKRYGDWKQIELNKSNQQFNWASFNKHLMNRYRATGINYIDLKHFEELSLYIMGKIDKTIFGRNNKKSNGRNYSTFIEHSNGIKE